MVNWCFLLVVLGYFFRLFFMFWANLSTSLPPKNPIHHLDSYGDMLHSPPRFDKAIRLAEKARFEGREDLVDTWKVPEERLGFFQGVLHASASHRFCFPAWNSGGKNVEMLCFSGTKKNPEKSRESVHVAFGFGQDIQSKRVWFNGLTCVSVLLQRIVGHGESMMTNDWLPVVLPEVWRLKWFDFRQVIQYFNKHCLSDWKSDSGQKAGRWQLFKPYHCPRNVDASWSSVGSNWIEKVIASSDFPWYAHCTIPRLMLDFGQKYVSWWSTNRTFSFPPLLFLVWGERCCPRFKDPRGSGSKHTFFWGFAGLRMGFPNSIRKLLAILL